MGQSLGSVMSSEEVNVLCMLANGARLSVDDVADILGCASDEVAHRMSRLSVLTGVQLETQVPFWGHA